MKRELTEKETFSRLKKNIRVCSIACPVSTVCMGALALVNAYTLFSDSMPVLFWSLFSVVFVAIIVFFVEYFLHRAAASSGCSDGARQRGKIAVKFAVQAVKCCEIMWNIKYERRRHSAF